MMSSTRETSSPPTRSLLSLLPHIDQGILTKRERISTVYLLVLSSYNQLPLILQTFTFLAKQATLILRFTALSFPLQKVFLAHAKGKSLPIFEHKPTKLDLYLDSSSSATMDILGLFSFLFHFSSSSTSSSSSCGQCYKTFYSRKLRC